jgi:hypothetical protein
MRHEVVEHVADKDERADQPDRPPARRQGRLVERLTHRPRSCALYTSEELLALADRGNVVLRGWGATVLLRPVPHVVCVRVTRLVPEARRMADEHLGTDDADSPAREIRRSDQRPCAA